MLAMILQYNTYHDKGITIKCIEIFKQGEENCHSARVCGGLFTQYYNFFSAFYQYFHSLNVPVIVNISVNQYTHISNICRNAITIS